MVKKNKKKTSESIFLAIIIVVIVAAVAGGLYKSGIIKFKGAQLDENEIAATIKLKGVQANENEIVASADVIEITQAELGQQYELFFLLVGYPDNFRDQITKELYLNQMVVEILLIQEADKLGISPETVSSDDLRIALDTYLKNNQLTLEGFAESLVSRNLTTTHLQDYFKNQIAINNFLNDSLLSKIEVNSNEIKAYYEQNSASFNAAEDQIRARHILVETEEEAKDIIEKIRQGEDFIDLAKELSLDTVSGARGGDLGFFSKEMMVAEFGDAAFELTINKISKPVETQFGWHIIQRQNDKILLEDVSDIIVLQLNQEKQRVALETYISQLKSKATIEIVGQAEEEVAEEEVAEEEVAEEEEPIEIEE